MFRRVLLGVGASAILALAGGCASSQEGVASTVNPLNSTQGPGQAGALVNQGRFPAPTYSQEQQPAYALTGEPQPQPGAPASGYYQAGNARIFIPPTPQQ